MAQTAPACQSLTPPRRRGPIQGWELDPNRFPSLNATIPSGPALRVAIAVLPGFPAMAFAALTEPLRAANGIAGRTLYDLKVVGGTASVWSSGTVGVIPDARPPDLPAVDRVMLLSGGDAATADVAPLLPWLRRLDARGAEIGAAADGALALARAGMLDGRRCAAHWTTRAAFEARFPDIPLEPNLWVIERRRLTCAGGTAALDMTLELVSRDHGAPLADAVAEWFCHARRPGTGALGPPQGRGAIPEGALRAAVVALERQVDGAYDPAALVAAAGIKRDALERRFRRALGIGPAGYLRRLRMDRAAELLRSTDMPVSGVALECGYADPAAFARAFRRETGTAPGHARWPAQ